MCLAEEIKLIFASPCVMAQKYQGWAYLDCTANRELTAEKGETAIRLWHYRRAYDGERRNYNAKVNNHA
jgi:hypothetical protein